MKARKTYRPAKIKQIYLLLALLTAVLALFVTSLTFSQERLPYADIQLAASQRMQRAEIFLKELIFEENILIEPEDINNTGLVGPEWTALTSTLGMLEAKRTSLNPNFAALIVKYFKDARLKEGDKVALGISGSFPGLGIAAISAANEMNLEPLVMASYSSSMYGGTRPKLPTIRMLRKLQDAGILSFNMLAISPGGDDDKGESGLSGLFEDSRELILSMAKEDGYPFIDNPNLEENIAYRLALYGHDIKCFVNVGGASVNIGSTGHFPEFKSGLIKDPSSIPTTANRGLIYEYAARGILVINLLNVRELAHQNGLPFDPVPLPQPGEGGVYLERTASPLPAIIAIAFIITILYVGYRRKKKMKH